MPTDYCEWGMCESWEHCCGKNVCCNETVFNPLLIIAISLGALMLIGLCCSCIFCNSRRTYTPLLKKYLGIYYVTMSSEAQSKSGSTPIRDGPSSSYSVHIDKA